MRKKVLYRSTPRYNVTQDVQHIILACDHPAVKAKRENFLARYAKYEKSFDVQTSRNKLRELLNLDPSCAVGCKAPAQKTICAFIDQVYSSWGVEVADVVKAPALVVWVAPAWVRTL